MINTNYSGSNYLNSISGQYKYSYTKMTSSFSNFNTAGVNNNSKTSYVNSSAVNYLQSIRTDAKDMLDSLSTLSKASTFNQMQAVSSNSSVLEIDSASSPKSGFNNTGVKVEQVATSQVNEGSAMRSNSNFGAASGKQQFEIEVGGEKRTISVDVKSTDTNKAVQQKMADAINGQNLGVRATVSTNSKTGVSTLNISSEKTGDNSRNVFSLNDVSGNLVAKTGADNTTQKAQNAIYSVNGERKTSESNQVDLGSGVLANLKKTGDASVAAKRGGGQDAAKALDSLVQSFNDLVSASKNSGNNRLGNELSNVFQSNSATLKTLGISAGSDGKLSIDWDKANKAIENGSVEALFSSKNSFGLGSSLAKTANNAAYNPAQYVVNTADTSQSQSSGGVRSFQDFLNQSGSGNSFFDSIMNSKSFNYANFNRYQNMGYLFDMFI